MNLKNLELYGKPNSNIKTTLTLIANKLGDADINSIYKYSTLNYVLKPMIGSGNTMIMSPCLQDTFILGRIDK